MSQPGSLSNNTVRSGGKAPARYTLTYHCTSYTACGRHKKPGTALHGHVDTVPAVYSSAPMPLGSVLGFVAVSRRIDEALRSYVYGAAQDKTPSSEAHAAAPPYPPIIHRGSASRLDGTAGTQYMPWYSSRWRG